MEVSKRTLALVLNRQDYREYDSLVSFYTQGYGKLTLMARGTKKLKSKLAGHLEPLSLVDLMIIPGKGRDYAGSAVVQEAFANLKADLNCLYYAGLGLRWFNKLVGENEADEESFLLLLNFLYILDAHGQEELNKELGELFFSFFIFKFMAAMGYRPATSDCLSCGRKITPGKNYFNLKNGGLICADCFSTRVPGEDNELLTISDNCVKLLRFMLDNNLDLSQKLKVDKKLIKEMAVLTRGFLNFRT
jgi:DNA repair protein RecO (recombination protein O)